MSIVNKMTDGLSATGRMLKSLVKIAVQSRPVSLPTNPDGDELIILANGPSLATTIAEHGELLRRSTTLAVNFAACAPEFTQLKPRYYLMADPHFFTRTEQPNVQRLYEVLRSVDWPMTVIVPRQYASTVRGLLQDRLTVADFNFVGLEGPTWFERLVYGARLGMPRPRNVLIPALMCAVWMGYRTVKVAGADHSWLRTLWVNDRNEVISVQPHFYKEDKKEEQRVRSEYTAYRLHQILYSFYVAFRSYDGVAMFARSRGVRIVNVTPDSFIDAFDRGKL